MTLCKSRIGFEPVPSKSLFALVALFVAACLAPLVRAQDLPEAVAQAEQERIAAIGKATKTAVGVFAKGGQGGGSGVVITPDGYALTNFHVSKPAGNAMKCSMADGNLYDAVIVGLDPTGDVALIKLVGRDDFPTAELGDSDELKVGDWCFAVGNPFLLATDFQPTVSYGILSGVHRYQYPAGTLLEYADCLQTDAAINPGNSGGPLFNSRGQLVGINGRGSFEKRGRVNVGVGYAISINQIKHFMGSLRSGRIVDHATLGAQVASDEGGKVLVSNITESSDAYRRGLRYGDEIVSFGDRPIATVNAFKNALGIYPKGWRLPLTYRRDGERHDIFVRLTGVHTEKELIAKTEGGGGPPKPAPKPGDKRKPDPEPKKEPEPKKDPAPGDKPKLPIPKLPGAGQPPAKPVPEHVAKLIKLRPGYANYYFNELNRDRVWKGFTAQGDFSSQSGTWFLEGALAGGGPVKITLGEKELSGDFPGEAAVVDLTKDLAEELSPKGSGGLLVALHLWRRMLTVGPTKYGDVYYQGTFPIPSQPTLVDVLVATHDVVETRFEFDPATGRLVGLEMTPDNGVDPCEVYFSDYREIDGRQIPHKLEVRHGDKIYGVLELKGLIFNKPAEKAA